MAKRGPAASRSATGQSLRKRPTWAPYGDATNNGRPMLALCDRARGGPHRVAEFQCAGSHPIQMPKSIADDGGDENGKHQRPAAKVEIEFHRMRFAGKRPQARPARKR